MNVAYYTACGWFFICELEHASRNACFTFFSNISWKAEVGELSPVEPNVFEPHLLLADLGMVVSSQLCCYLHWTVGLMCIACCHRGTDLKALTRDSANSWWTLLWKEYFMSNFCSLYLERMPDQLLWFIPFCIGSCSASTPMVSECLLDFLVIKSIRKQD